MHGRIEGVNEPHSLVVRNLKKCAKMRLIVAGTLNLALHFPEMLIHRFVQLKMSLQCRTKSDFIFVQSQMHISILAFLTVGNCWFLIFNLKSLKSFDLDAELRRS
jgi:hypothetical protein